MLLAALLTFCYTCDDFLLHLCRVRHVMYSVYRLQRLCCVEWVYQLFISVYRVRLFFIVIVICNLVLPPLSVAVGGCPEVAPNASSTVCVKVVIGARCLVTSHTYIGEGEHRLSLDFLYCKFWLDVFFLLHFFRCCFISTNGAMPFVDSFLQSKVSFTQI